MPSLLTHTITHKGKKHDRHIQCPFHLIFFVKYRISPIFCTPFCVNVTTLSAGLAMQTSLISDHTHKKDKNMIAIFILLFTGNSQLKYFLYFVCPYSFIGTTTSGGLTMSTVPVWRCSTHRNYVPMMPPLWWLVSCTLRSHPTRTAWRPQPCVLQRIPG